MWLKDNVNLIGLIGAIVILFLTIAISWFYISKMKNSKAEGELTDHEWDGIREFSNDIPVGWLLALLGTIIWAIWYIFFGYPLHSYSQAGEYNEDSRALAAQFEDLHKNATPQQLEEMGQEIFLVQCSQCHGLTAEGMNGKAQNLTHWGKEQGIIDTITNGSKGLNYMGGEMPAGLLDAEADKEAVASYIMNDFVKDTSKTYDLAILEKGKEIYSQSCAVCHGDSGKGDGSGVPGFAAPLDTYGKFEFVKHVLGNGKEGNIGRMPSFNFLNFSEVQIKALAAFLASKKPLD